MPRRPFEVLERLRVNNLNSSRGIIASRCRSAGEIAPRHIFCNKSIWRCVLRTAAFDRSWPSPRKKWIGVDLLR